MFNYSSPRRPHYAVSLYVQPVLCPHLFVSSLPSTIIQRSPSFKQKTQRSLLSCTFSNPSASPLCSCLPLVPTAASVSWQNIEGKFHGWWRRCENVTLWAINKEVWLTLTGPFFTWVCFAAFLASFFPRRCTHFWALRSFMSPLFASERTSSCTLTSTHTRTHT